ncbi:hypothetical protein SLH49_09160 [Cognatiyoonia sp. IB215446]|uniref:hypothetical protein n=1 Tax=Cognatiyoonia sp. IB215446 TaxID=3097355 RepID=UPI002A119A18|nr:hypothetical protein [Cognatiyoonia sp. IB215446]MDX8348154.1 hypothetical protein [Cognatiyoonia sp. IB215446]
MAFKEVGVWPWLITGLVERLSKRQWSALQVQKVEFAVTYLETDLMQFRSGYFKGKLIRRLGQVELSPEHRERVVGLLKRAVLQGAGREEFFAYCKLAAKIRPEGLRAWLNSYALDAQISVQDWEGPSMQASWKEVMQNGVYLLRYGSIHWFARKQETGSPLWVTAQRIQTPEQQIARNAWYMLMRLELSLSSDSRIALPVQSTAKD